MRPSPRAETILDPVVLGSMALPTDERQDKRARGTVLVVGGSASTPGAAMLAGVAALRIGAGRLQIATDPLIVTPMGIAVPEALVTSYDDNDGDRLALRQLLAASDAVVIGPGLSDLGRAGELLEAVVETVRDGVPVIVDALAIAAFAALGDRPAGRASVIVTPNRGELAELAGQDTEASTDGLMEQAVAVERGVTVVSFGWIVTADGRSWRDPGTVSGLGTSGAGDVLAGTVAGLAARCGDALIASCWATVCHRVAANRLADSIAPVGYLARELADELPKALDALQRSTAKRPTPSADDAKQALG